MRGFGHLVLFTFFYLLLIIVIRDVVGEPRGILFPTEPINEQRPGGPCYGPNCPPSGIHNGSILQNPLKGIPNQTIISGPEKGFVESNASNIVKELSANSSRPVPVEEATFPKERAQSQQTAQNSNGTSNPLVQMFDVSDPDTKSALDTVYGTYAGNDQCTRKAFCVMGNYMLEIPGKDLIFMIMGRYVPPEYSIYFDIFRNSALYGQNCNVYVCIHPSTDSSTSTTTASPLTGLNNSPIIKAKQ